MQNEFVVSRGVLIYAFRYALSRETYAPMLVVGEIKKNITAVSTSDISLYIKEINEYDNLGVSYDREYWLSFLSYLEDVVANRCDSK